MTPTELMERPTNKAAKKKASGRSGPAPVPGRSTKPRRPRAQAPKQQNHDPNHIHSSSSDRPINAFRECFNKRERSPSVGGIGNCATPMILRITSTAA